MQHFLGHALRGRQDRLRGRGGEPHALRPLLRRAVVCLSGSLWITVDDDPRDVILAPGDRHVFAPDDGDAIVSAMQDSSLLLLDLGGELVPPHGPAAKVAP